MYGNKEKCKHIHDANVKKGFWDGFENKEDRLEECIALIHAEISEMLEAHRDNKHANLQEFNNEMYLEGKDFYNSFKRNIKDTVEDEFADIAIRVMDLAGAFNVDISTPKAQITLSGNIPKIVNLLHNETNLIWIYLGVEDNVNLYTGLRSLFRTIVSAAEGLNINLREHIGLKLEYNKLRPYKHGKNY